MLLYGEAIKSARLNAHMTQKEVAEALKVTQVTISNWESDKRAAPSTKRITQMADLFNVSTDSLIRK